MITAMRRGKDWKSGLPAPGLEPAVQGVAWWQPLWYYRAEICL